MNPNSELGRRKLLTKLSFMLITGTGLTVLGACTKKPPSYKAVDITGADFAKQFALQDYNGKVRTLQEFKDQFVVVFFGFTQCPDVCPTSMAELGEVKKALAPTGHKIQVIFITVDPERDTAPLLKTYTENFDSSFIALRPTPAELANVAKDFKIYYRKVPSENSKSYTMDHTAGHYIFDPLGRARLFVRYGTSAKDVASDIQLLAENL